MLHGTPQFRDSVRAGSFRAASSLMVAGAVAALLAQGGFVPARYIAGPSPALAVQAVGGAEVFVEVNVSKTGHVNRVTPLRVTPLFVNPLLAAVQQWQFRPAEDDDPVSSSNPKAKRVVESRVLVAGLFRPPTLNTPTLGTVPRDVAPGSDDMPFPLAPVTPPYPPHALFSGVVMVEVEIGRTGAVTKASVVRSDPAFDASAVTAARQWTFRPARRQGQSVVAVAYLVFGFPQPINARR